MLFINTKLKPWLLEQGGMQIVRDLLETVDLSDFHPWGEPPMTDSKRKMIGFSPREELAEFQKVSKNLDWAGIPTARLLLKASVGV